MKKFLLEILLFSLPLILVAYPADIFLSRNLKKSVLGAHGEYTIWNKVFSDSLQAKIIVVGSSKAKRNIDPRILQDSFHVPAYDLGLDGHNFRLQYFRYQAYLQNNTLPDYIVVVFDQHIFEKRADLYNYEQFLPYMLWNNDIQKATKNYEGFNDIDFQIPLVRYYGNFLSTRLAIHSALGIEKHSAPLLGFTETNGDWDNQFEMRKSKYKINKVIYPSSEIKLFEDFLDECKQKHIKVVCCLPPSYFETRKYIVNKTAVFDLFKNICYKHNASFYNFYYDKISLDKYYFYDEEHLNQTGTIIFTTHLVDSIKRDKIFKMP